MSDVAPDRSDFALNGATSDLLAGIAFGGNNTSGPIEVATTLRAKGGTGHGDFESETFVTHALRAERFDASEDGTGRGTPLVPFAAQGVALRGREGGATAELTGEIMPTLSTGGGGGGKAHVLTSVAQGAKCDGIVGVDISHALTAARGRASSNAADAETFVPFHAVGEHSVGYRVTGNDGAYVTGDIVGALSTGTDRTASVIVGLDIAGDGSGDTSYTAEVLRIACGCGNVFFGCLDTPCLSCGEITSASVTCSTGADVVSFNARQSPVIEDGIVGTLDADGTTHAVAWAENSRAELRLEGGDGQTTGALKTGGGKPGQSYPVVATAPAGGLPEHRRGSALTVRRLTPTECERLMGVPDGYTQVPFRGRAASDGPRYKALGNSIAVPVLAWIGRQMATSMFAGKGADHV
jgi:C-5 cytosine-specific DNA methylase